MTDQGTIIGTTFAQTGEKERDEIRGAVADFTAKAGAANARNKVWLGDEVDKLEVDLYEVQQRLLELKSATVESWHHVTDAFGKALDQRKARVENFRKNSA